MPEMGFSDPSLTLKFGEILRPKRGKRHAHVHLRGPPGPHPGSLHIASVHIPPSYTVHILLNGDLQVPRSTNSKHISISAFRREKSMSYNVAPGVSGTIAISFPHHVRTLSLTPLSLLNRSRAWLILSQSFYPLPP